MKNLETLIRSTKACIINRIQEIEERRSSIKDMIEKNGYPSPVFKIKKLNFKFKKLFERNIQKIWFTTSSPFPFLSIRTQYQETHFTWNPSAHTYQYHRRFSYQATHSYHTIIRTREETETKKNKTYF